MTATRHRVLVLGGTGFVGRYVIARLAADGHFVVALTRRRSRAHHLFMLPTVQIVDGDANDPATLARQMKGVTAVINLVGVLNERGRATFEREHVELPRSIVAACQGAGVTRLLHMSALGASADGPSQYLRSKAAGEAVVTASGLGWTIFRPSVIFGREDAFLNLFAKLARVFPVLPVASGNARFQPVHVGDVATCFAHALVDLDTIGHTYSLCGPSQYSLRDLVRYVAAISGNPRPVVALGPGLSSLQARVMEFLPGSLLTRDNLASMQVDNVCDGAFPVRFGVIPATLESVAPDYLAPQAQHSRFDLFRAHGGR